MDVAGILKVGDLVRMVAGGPLMVVVSVATTPNGTVMVGCKLAHQPIMPKIEVPLERLTTVH